MDVTDALYKCLTDDTPRMDTGWASLSRWSLCATNIDVANKSNNMIYMTCDCVGLYLFPCMKVDVGCDCRVWTWCISGSRILKVKLHAPSIDNM